MSRELKVWADEAGVYVTCGPRNRDVAAEFPLTVQGKADARLFAAAERLLAACEAAEETHFHVIDALKRVPGTEALRQSLYEQLDARRAAIAEAKP